MVVVVIIGLGWFLLLPRLNLVQGEKSHTRLDTLNAFLAQIKTEAEGNQTIQRIYVSVGGEKLTWGNQVYILPAPVSACRINGGTPPGLRYPFSVYPDGIMDSVQMELRSRDRLYSNVLLVRFDATPPYDERMSQDVP